MNLQIPLTGLLASSANLTARASNVANIDTKGPIPGRAEREGPKVYEAIQPQQTAVAGGGGVRTVFRPTTPPYLQQYEPEQPYADEAGMVAVPNVDLAREAIGSILDRTTYKANAKAFQVIAETERELLNLKT